MEGSLKSQRISENFDPKLPERLKRIQIWFGSVISQRMQPDNKIPSETPFGNAIETEAKEYIAPSHSLAPHERIQIYHQQYWWRLLKILRENYPMVVRLFGRRPFDLEIAIPYLCKHPPNHWALNRLGAALPNWVREDYRGDDQELISLCADIDWATQKCFWADSKPTLNAERSLEKIIEAPLSLQPHVHLFSLSCDLFSFRDAFLKEEIDHWNTHAFPELRHGKFYFSIFRSTKNIVCWKSLSQGEYRLLSLIKEGNSILQSCEILEKEGGEILTQAQDFMPLWFREWTESGWFAIMDSI